MRVLFDTSVTDFDRGGTSRYVASLLPRLRSATASGRVGAAEGGVVVQEVSMQATWRWSARLPRAARVLLHDLAWIPWGAVRLGRASGADLYHGAGFKVPPRAPFKTCVSIMDDTPWDDPPTARPYNRAYMRRLLESAAPHLAGALTIARSSATAISGRLPALEGRLHVTPLGVDHQVFRPRPEPEVREAKMIAGIEAPYALLVSPYGPRKNLTRMLEALAVVRDGNPGLHALVVGRHDPVPETSRVPVVTCGRVSDNQLAALYSGAEFLLFASLKEGFGLPAVEAMACGCPVVTSRGTTMEEIGGDAVVLADPTSTAEMAAACLGLLSDRTLRDRQVKLGIARAAEFTWEATARLTLSAWEKMVR